MLAVTLLITAVLAPVTLAASSDSDIEGVKKQIDELDTQLSRIAREYDGASTQLSTTSQLVEENKKRIDELDKDIVVNQARVNKRVADIYKNGAGSVVEAVLNAQSLMHMINRLDALVIIGSADAEALSKLQASKAEQEKIKQELEEAKETQAKLAKTLRYKRSIIDSKLRQEKKVLASLSIAEEMGILKGKNQPTRVSRDNETQANVRIGNFVFPVLGPSTYTDSWGAPRTGHRHQGTDIFAISGTPLVACVAGSVLATWTSGGGKTIYLDGDDGNLYIYMHCSDYEISAGHVQPGDVVAYCGMTGNASGPHLHFEIHVGGSRPIDPYPILQSTGF